MDLICGYILVSVLAWSDYRYCDLEPMLNIWLGGSVDVMWKCDCGSLDFSGSKGVCKEQNCYIRPTLEEIMKERKSLGVDINGGQDG